MKKKHRLKKNEEFQEIIKNKRFFSCSTFVLYYTNKKEEDSRFGVSVGKKLGKAHLRNKIKRQTKMMLQDLKSTKYNFDGVIIVREKYQQVSYDENKKNLESLLKKVTM